MPIHHVSHFSPADAEALAGHLKLTGFWTSGVCVGDPNMFAAPAGDGLVMTERAGPMSSRGVREMFVIDGRGRALCYAPLDANWKPLAENGCFHGIDASAYLPSRDPLSDVREAVAAGWKKLGTTPVYLHGVKAGLADACSPRMLLPLIAAAAEAKEAATLRLVPNSEALFGSEAANARVTDPETFRASLEAILPVPIAAKIDLERHGPFEEAVATLRDKMADCGIPSFCFSGMLTDIT
ncbi:MAG: hypothetical protein VR70_10805 [Rhodospirillaceae bacterium BRH_c57]|nr:MAG: hypothetical protein VR70_10805 [Rhodospirillaceae bacterium BRH_c57]